MAINKDFIDKIFVINLNSSREDIKKRLANVPFSTFVPYHILNAINGWEVREGISKCVYDFKVADWWKIEESSNRFYNREVTHGEVGCGLSHYHCIDLAYKEGCDCILILEEDFVPLGRWPSVKMFEEIPSDWSLVYLDRNQNCRDSDEQMISTHVTKVGYSYNTHAYLVSRKGMEEFLASSFLDNVIASDEFFSAINGVSNRKDAVEIFHNPNFKAYAFQGGFFNQSSNINTNSLTEFDPSCFVKSQNLVEEKSLDDVLLVSVASEHNDCVKRYIKTCNRFGFNPHILGLQEEWKGGDMAAGIGGGQKINLLKKYLNSITGNKLLIFTDSYDVLVNNHVNSMIDTYQEKFSGKVVFASEMSCWPRSSLASQYPEVDVPNKFLNSGVFMGHVEDIKEIVSGEINDNEDDQLFYTEKFLQSYYVGEEKKIVLDYKNDLFVCLNGAADRVFINKRTSCLLNSESNTRPFFIHGNGPADIKRELNHIENYIFWNSTSVYKNPILKKETPSILLIFDELNFPDESVIKNIININYPKDLMNCVYAYQDKPSQLLLDAFPDLLGIKKEDNYFSDLIETSQRFNFDYVFYVSSHSVLINKDVLLHLISEDKSVIAPLLKKRGFNFANFWGALDNNNFYKDSADYLDIAYNKQRGCWNVPYVSHALLIKKEFFTKNMFIDNLDKGYGVNMAFCYNMRKSNYFMYVLNTEDFGYYCESEILDSFNNFSLNKEAWEKKYIHPSFLQSKSSEVIGDNIYQVKLFTEKFCKEIIQLGEGAGDWSQGGDSHYDARIGNKENHPTQDVHLKDIGLQDMWKFVVDNYIAPLVWKEYKYETNSINISFVVKYSIDGQKELRSHHDSSTYTVSVCLNKDFTGGGCFFVKQDKTVINKEVGTLILHPGKLTHYHQGLPINSGERYILVSFIN